MLLVDVVKKKIYLHLKHLHLSCVRSRQFSPEHIKYRNRKPADLLTGLKTVVRSTATTAIPRLFAGCGVICDMVVLMMLVSPGPACFRHMMAARTVFAVRGWRAGPGH